MLAAARAELASGESGAGADGAAAKPHKKRIRNFTADDRAAHRIFEKKRRELFRERLNDLARELPALAGKNPSRLSKHDVVDESISRHRLEHNTCLDLIQGLQTMLEERDELLAEVNTWRARAGVPERQATSTQMDLTELSRLKSKIRGGEGEPSANQSPVTEKRVMATEGLLPQLDCPAPTNPTSTIQTDQWKWLADIERPRVVETTAQVTGHLPHSDVLANPPVETPGLIDMQHIPNQITQSLAMPIKYPITEANTNSNAEIHSENRVTQSNLDDLLPFNSIQPVNHSVLPDWCPTEFPVSITSMDFDTDTMLQPYCF
ncbi:Isoflavone reductase like protein P3 [Fusarium austroafricanum]|uniref:Isoflavone reductase like protein P3 n=1 Tax=Fusarium austroafricanum TaxID=2364996 RepID=A0A8H4P6I0_9HYPO|nr:Isoflavone reductase like protein P3 [Fusarium austroafricanum]